MARLVPFVFIANQHDFRGVDDFIQGYRVGADDCLIQPFAPEEFIAKINAALERIQRIRAEISRRAQEQLIHPVEATRLQLKLLSLTFSFCPPHV